MNRTEYEQAKLALTDAVRRGDFEAAEAIRLLITTFYNPDRGPNVH